MTFYIFCSLYQRVVLISTMPYSRKEVSALMQGALGSDFAQIESPGLFTNMNFVVKGRFKAGDNGRIFCRTS